VQLAKNKFYGEKVIQDGIVEKKVKQTETISLGTQHHQHGKILAQQHYRKINRITNGYDRFR
jgi:hypothetical protein